MKNVIYNYTKNKKNLKLFEIGKTYHKDTSFDTSFNEYYKIGIIFTGLKIEKGFNIMDNIKHDIYDIGNYLSIIFFELENEYILKEESFPFFEKNKSYKIEYNN